MRNFVLLVLAVLFMGSCKKAIEQTQLDALMKLITNGQWKVTTYKRDGNDVTAQFGVYLFQFKDDGTVDAIKNGRVDKTGTWVGNSSNLTIQSSFGNVEAPLNLLNGTWSVTKTSTTFVESRQLVNAEERFLRLDKQ